MNKSVDLVPGFFYVNMTAEPRILPNSVHFKSASFSLRTRAGLHTGGDAENQIDRRRTLGCRDTSWSVVDKHLERKKGILEFSLGH